MGEKKRKRLMIWGVIRDLAKTKNKRGRKGLQNSNIQKKAREQVNSPELEYRLN